MNKAYYLCRGYCLTLNIRSKDPVLGTRFSQNNRVIHKVTLSFTSIPSVFTSYPLFEWYLQSKEILLNLSMKCWNSALNAQGSKVTIVVVQEGAVRIYVAAVEALRKKERQDETQFTTKIGGKTSLGPSYFVL
jgi:hypothetical protein